MASVLEAELVTVNTSDARLRQAYQQHVQGLQLRRVRMLKQLGIDSISLRTHEDFTPKLHKFFQLRARRFH